jgi:NitT/TauT family transport system permease protein
VIDLVWNSMMSMAGGWFFLTVTEAFTLGDHDFRLPGIGSYMAVAIERNDGRAVAWALVAMTAMIVAVDQLLWRPLVAWSQRFRLEDVGGEAPPTSWMLDLLRRSALLRRARRALRAARERRGRARVPDAPLAPVDVGEKGTLLRTALAWGVAAAAGLGAVLGAIRLFRLLSRVTAVEWGTVAAGLGATSLRTAGALLLSVLWTVPAGLLIGRRPALARRLQPIVQIAASFPAPMIFPLVAAGLFALRIPFAAVAAVLMLLGAQWYVLFNVLAGTSAIPHDLDEAADVYGLSGAAKWKTLFLPGVFPFLVTGLVTAAGGAWNASIVAESLVFRGKTLSTFGLGSLITRATREANFPLLAAGVLTMSLALVLLNRFVWRRLWRLAETKYSLNR